MMSKTDEESATGTPREGWHKVLTVVLGSVDCDSSQSFTSGSEPHCPVSCSAPVAGPPGTRPDDGAPEGDVPPDVRTIQPRTLAIGRPRARSSSCPLPTSCRPISGGHFTYISHPPQVAAAATSTHPLRPACPPPNPSPPLLPLDFVGSKPSPNQSSTINPGPTTPTRRNTMSEGVKEKTPRKRGSLFFGVDESATSTSHRHQIGDQVPNHDGDDDEDYRDDDIDPLITPEAQRTGFLPPTRRPVTRSQTKRRRLDTSGSI